MGVLEILLIIFCAAIVIGVIITSVIRKKQGKSSCDCGCNCCHNEHCSVKNEKLPK